VQPAFDAAWGGPAGMYAARLGVDRAVQLNPFAALAAAGVLLAFGSDSPVTPFAPWEAVRAATFHTDPAQRISARSAFAAHTRGASRAARRFDEGVLLPGAAATLAVWAVGDLVVQAPDDRVQAWSTDPRSGTPGLPDLTPGTPAPQCLRTVVRGRVVHDRLT
jgi:predicted amidohydrolase YtcJ